MRMYDYLLAYNFEKNGCLTPCSGTSHMSLPKKIKTFEDLNELNKDIAERIDGASNLSIYNFILLGRNKR